MNYWITKLSSLNPLDEKKEALFVVNQMTATTARNLGFKEINYIPFLNLQNNCDRRTNLLEAMIAPIEKGDLVVVQLPLWTQLNFQNELIDALRKKGIKLIGLLNTVIPYKNGETYDPETNFFLTQMQKFDLLITPNEQIAQKLKEDKIKTRMISLMGNDFLFQGPIRNNQFVKRLLYISEDPIVTTADIPKFKTPLTIYGQNSSTLSKSDYVTFCSDSSFEELPYFLNDGFGLVNLPKLQEETEKDFSNPLEFDNSLSLSIFLAAGIPVIVLSNTPYASWVSSKQIGLVVSDWSEVDAVVEKTTLAEYQNMLDAVKGMQEAIRTGVFTKRALLNGIRILELGYVEDILKESGEAKE